MDKRGSIEMSFGMIFSIILIIALLAVAIYAINAFLNIGKAAGLAKFHQHFQETIDDVWASSITNKVVLFSVPSRLTHVCFGSIATTNYNSVYEKQHNELVRYASNVQKQKTNLFLQPQSVAEEFTYQTIDRIDTSGMKNGFDCFMVKDGAVKVRLIKEDFNPLVKVLHE